MSKTLDLVFEEIPTKVEGEYRLDGRIGRKYCALMFPTGFSRLRAMRIIRRRLGLLPESLVP